MKKITLLAGALLMSLGTFAQVTFENNAGDTTVTGANAVGCGSDNNWGRNFTLSEFTVPEDLGLLSGQIGIQTANGGDVVVNVYSSSPTFDEGALMLLGSQTVTVPAVVDGDSQSVDFDFDEPILVDDTVEALFMEVVDAGDAMFIGGTAGNTAGKESWLKSVTCGVEDYVTAASIGFGDAQFFLTLTGDTILSTDGFALSQISVFPNPATEILNVNIPSTVELNGVTLYDVLGKSTNVSLSNGQINVSNLARGVYILNVDTSAGTLTEKVVIE